MKKVMSAVATLGLLSTLFYACNNADDDNNTTPVPAASTPLTATINSAGTSTSATSGSSTATGSFSGNLNRTTNVMSYTVSYSGLNATAVTLDPVTTGTVSGTAAYANSILLAGSFPSVTTPGSGTSTTPGSGTSTTPGSGTSTTPGSGTSTTPGSGTSTTPGSGTSTTPGSGTAVAITSPLSGTVSVSASRADSISRGLYRINIRTTTAPTGEIGGIIRTQ
ncbi:hypothetical protein [Rudanella paleaurantiibacter]|uniref:hypothetical protein n=1 Tax=Rudanella paleaurantiibacter TaxID=2614655 RepID=UPI001FEBBF0C|nr:hypothetical protein [Rudanella paleaurantiibacter]